MEGELTEAKAGGGNAGGRHKEHGPGVLESSPDRTGCLNVCAGRRKVMEHYFQFLTCAHGLIMVP